MEILVGAILAIGTMLFLISSRLDRDRGVYPVMLIVIASYYLLFAAIDGRGHVIFLEAASMIVFLAVALFAFQKSAWLIVFGLAGHGAFDAVHGLLVESRGVPVWWPGFCMAFDLGAATILAAVLWRGQTSEVKAGAG